MITQTKKNFFDRLFGRTNDKSRYSQQEEENPPIPSLGGSLPQQPASAQAGSPTAQTPQPQTQSEAPGGAAGAGQGASRYKLFEMFQPEPTRDTESEEMIRRRARINAFGSGLGAIAGLAGMAAGGDAPAIPDLQTPWNMQEMQRLDQNYRGQLENWVNRRFQVDQANTNMQNREIEQDINAENRMAQIQAQGENSMAAIEARLAADLEKFNAKTQAEQIKEMEDLGINPYSEDAYSQYINARKRQFETEIDYTKARTNWNNRPYSSAGRAAGGSDQLPYSLGTLKTGRDAMIQELRTQLQSINPNLPQNEAQIKMISDRIKQLENYKPGSNELMDMEIAERGMAIEDQQLAGTQDTAQQQGLGMPYQPGQGFQTEQMQMGQNSAVQKQEQPAPAQTDSATQVKPLPNVDYSKMDEKAKMERMRQNRQLVEQNSEFIRNVNFEDPAYQDLIYQLVDDLVLMGVIEEGETQEEKEQIAFEMILKAAGQDLN